MIQINLLPWREEARLRKKNQFGVGIIGSSCLGILIILFFHLYLSSINSEQNSINADLQAAIGKEQASLTQMSSEESEKEAITLQLHTIVDLYNESYQAVRLLNELTKLVPTTISLTKIKRNGNEITLMGVALSEDDVTHFMRDIAASPYFKQPVLSSINTEKNTSGNQRNFQLEVEQKG